MRIVNVPVEDRVVVIQRSGGVASNYDCNTCQCPVSFTGSLYLGPASFNLLPGQSGGCVCTAIYKDCNGVIYPEGVTGQAGWSSSNTGVATVSSTGLVTGVAIGTASIKATFVGEQWYYYAPQARCNFIPIPASTEASCTVSAYPVGLRITGVTTTGGVLEFNYAFSSSTGNLSDLSNCGLTENVTYPGGTRTTGRIPRGATVPQIQVLAPTLHPRERRAHSPMTRCPAISSSPMRLPGSPQPRPTTTPATAGK